MCCSFTCCSHRLHISCTTFQGKTNIVLLPSYQFPNRIVILKLKFVDFLCRFGHGSKFSKLASQDQSEQTDYVVGVRTEQRKYSSFVSSNHLLPWSIVWFFGHFFIQQSSLQCPTLLFPSSSCGRLQSLLFDAWGQDEQRSSQEEYASNQIKAKASGYHGTFGNCDACLWFWGFP